MVRGFVVKANTITGDPNVDKSITGFQYNNLDVICTKIDEDNLEINTVDTVKQIMEITDDIDIEELKNKFVDFKNGIVSNESDD